MIIYKYSSQNFRKIERKFDILDLTEGTIYEILHTETEQKYKEKTKKYPKELRVIKIRC
ncbi:MAG: hypothetical protein KKA79_08140 [Nanoarchaeota archaeon]|nr:hypothetical protein [Nanoarchaeota archaeon]